MKKKLISLFILLFTIAYVIGFGIYYLIIQNYEFLIYVVVLIAFISFMTLLHLKYKFNNWVLLGVSIWGLMHMCGGSVHINGARLYAFMIYDVFPASVTGTAIFRYDQLAHFFCYFVFTFVIYHIMKYYSKDNANKLAIYILTILASIGVGSINEIIEFIPVLILKTTGVGDYFNTLWDIVFNALGALTSVLVIWWMKK